MEKSVIQELLKLGMDKEDINTHESDLYVLKNEISTYFVENVYRYPGNVTTFVDDIDGNVWYEIPFGA